jgi:hypothetical protein
MYYTVIFGLLLIIFSLYAYYDFLATFSFSNNVRLLHEFWNDIINRQWLLNKINNNTIHFEYYRDQYHYDSLAENKISKHKYYQLLKK